MRAVEHRRRWIGQQMGQSGQKALGAGHKLGMRSGKKLTGGDVPGLLDSGPVVVAEPEGNPEAEDPQQFHEVIRPSGADRAGSHGVLEGKIPADDPGEEFAQRGVGVCVSRAGQGNHGRKLGVTKARKGAADAAQHEGEHEAGTGPVRAQAGHHKNARPDHRAHAQRGERNRPQGTLQVVFSHLLGFGDDQAERFPPEEFRHAKGLLLYLQVLVLAGAGRPNRVYFFRADQKR